MGSQWQQIFYRERNENVTLLPFEMEEGPRSQGTWVVSGSSKDMLTLKKTKSLIQKDVCTLTFTAALFITIRIQEQLKCP